MQDIATRVPDYFPPRLMAENYRTGFIWENFMKTHEVQRAMKLVGFRPSVPAATGNGGSPRIHKGEGALWRSGNSSI